jgi:hypothetical protein
MNTTIVYVVWLGLMVWIMNLSWLSTGMGQGVATHAVAKRVANKEFSMKEKKPRNKRSNESHPNLSSMQLENDDSIEQKGMYILPGSPEMEQSLEREDRDKVDTVYPGVGPVLEGGTSGSLTFYAVPNPTSWYDTQKESAQWLDLVFDGADWDAVFHDVLGVPKVRAKGETKDGDLGIHGYPMLSRLDDMYEDVIYKREEVGQLRAECIKVQESTQHPLALKGLQTFIRACDEALRLNMGLYLAGD